MKELKLYVQDHGWAGMIVVTAYSEENAHEKMKKLNFHNYLYEYGVEEYIIDEDFEYENVGDS